MVDCKKVYIWIKTAWGFWVQQWWHVVCVLPVKELLFFWKWVISSSDGGTIKRIVMYLPQQCLAPHFLCSLNSTQLLRLINAQKLLEFQSYTVGAAKVRWYIIHEKMQSICQEKEYISMCCVLLVGSAGSEPAAQLCEKAKHHSASVCKVDGHLARQKDDPDNTERYTLHGSLIWMSSKSVCVCVFLLWTLFIWWLLQGDVVGNTREDGCKTQSVGCVQSCVSFLFAVRWWEVDQDWQ